MIVHRRGPADLLQEVMLMKKSGRALAVIACFLILCGCGESGTVYSVADSGARIGESASETISSDNAVGSISVKETSGKTKTLFVYVCGEVSRPGVYELPENSRVYQALDAAGGMTEAADRKMINQAELLSDGQQITVYSVEETSAPGFSGTAAGTPSGAQQSGRAYETVRHWRESGRGYYPIPGGTWKIFFCRRYPECKRDRRKKLPEDKRSD